MAKKQNEVNYRTGDDATSCSNCIYYQSPDACSQVEGLISAGGLCDLWAPLDGGAGIEDMLFGGGMPNV